MAYTIAGMSSIRAAWAGRVLWACGVALALAPCSLGIDVATASEPLDTTVSAAAEPDNAVRATGRAYTGRRTPVVGASVVVRPASPGAPVYVTSTDARGELTLLGLPDGMYRVEIRKAGLAPVVKDGVVLRRISRPVLEVPMRVDAAPGLERVAAEPEEEGVVGTRPDVMGAVHDRSGGPIPDASIRLSPLGLVADPLAVRSRADGRFRIEGVAPGPWRLEVRAVGFLPIRAPVAIEPGSGIEIRARVVPQPADYVAAPIDLMPAEAPLPPPGFGPRPPAPSR